jgi:hypothetical protein
MRRSFDARLARMAKTTKALTPTGDPTAARHRLALRARIAIAALLGERSGRPDGAAATAVRLGDVATAELADIPDTPALRTNDAALVDGDDGDAPREFAARIERLARQYRDRREPDLATASPAEMLALWIARSAEGEQPAPGRRGSLRPPRPPLPRRSPGPCRSR